MHSSLENSTKSSDRTDATDQEIEDAVLEGLEGNLPYRFEPVATLSVSDSSVEVEDRGKGAENQWVIAMDIDRLQYTELWAVTKICAS